MKVIVTDYTFPSLDLEAGVLEPLGCELVGMQCKTSAEAAAAVADADCVVTQFAPIDAGVIGAMRKARAIVRYGIGVDNVDLAAARERGIPVCNVPDFCIDEVADHTLAFILAATRNVVPNCLGVRGGEWRLAVPIEAMRTLRELTVGIVGFGRIGRAVAQRLMPFGGRLLAHDPGVPGIEVTAAGVAPRQLEALLAESDLITLHCPATAATRRMIDAAAIARMKPGVILVNLARGALVDSAALVDGLQRGHISAAALDVFDPEPIPPGHPLLAMSNVVVAAHVSSASPKAVRRLRETVAHIVACCVRGQPLPNIVNGVTARSG
ncbi:MAG TPA: C-terminal binding protein [Pirellulales bacterium]|nr:C-terminal binding protein [Pirellulales bacterium]